MGKSHFRLGNNGNEREVGDAHKRTGWVYVFAYYAFVLFVCLLF